MSRVRLLFEDGEAALPRVMKALDCADVRYFDVPRPSFDEVFFRLVQGTSEETAPGARARPLDAGPGV